MRAVRHQAEPVVVHEAARQRSGACSAAGRREHEPPARTAAMRLAQPAPTKGTIFMCNHLSNADPFFVCAGARRACWGEPRGRAAWCVPQRPRSPHAARAHAALLPIETKYVAKGKRPAPARVPASRPLTAAGVAQPPCSRCPSAAGPCGLRATSLSTSRRRRAVRVYACRAPAARLGASFRVPPCPPAPARPPVATELSGSAQDGAPSRAASAK
jgi:hypothetical protein